MRALTAKLVCLAAAFMAAAVLSGCQQPVPPAKPPAVLQQLPSGEPTGTHEWGAERRAPEMARALSSLEEQEAESKSYGYSRLNGKSGLGKGRFVGVVVSWIPPNAKIANPPGDYAQIVVAPDGTFSAAPEADVPTGFLTDGSTIELDSPEMAAYKKDAVALADGYVGPSLLVSPYRVASDGGPYVSGYVLEYSWGVVTITPDLNQAESNHPQVTEAPRGGWQWVKPLPSAERRRLDSLSATEVARVYWRNEEPDEVYWLHAPRYRYDYLRHRGFPAKRPNATVTFDYQSGDGMGFGYVDVTLFKADPPVFGPDSDEWIFIGRRDAGSPWRFLGLGA